jgi:hypothetical protein
MMPEYRIRAVAFRRGNWWVAQCLDYALATQTRTLEELPYELERLLTVQVQASLARGIEPFSDFAPAPPKYWEMYERARARVEPVPGSDAGPAAIHPVIQTETRLAA